MGKSRHDEMAELFALRERDGLTYAELSEQSGIPVSTLSWWRRRLRSEDHPVFTELDIVDDPPTDIAVASPGAIRITIAGVVIEVAEGFESNDLARAIDVVRDRC